MSSVLSVCKVYYCGDVVVESKHNIELIVRLNPKSTSKTYNTKRHPTESQPACVKREWLIRIKSGYRFLKQPVSPYNLLLQFKPPLNDKSPMLILQHSLYGGEEPASH